MTTIEWDLEEIRAWVQAAEPTSLRQLVGLDWQGEISPEHVVQVLRPTEDFVESDRALSIGTLAVLADSTAGTAGAVSGGYRHGVTLGLRVELTQRRPASAVPIVAEATVVHADGAGCLVTTTLTDPQGDGLGYASVRGLAADRGPDGGRRQPADLPQDRTERVTLAPLRPEARGSRIDRALGVVESSAEDGRSRLQVRPDRQLANGSGRLHGGVVAAVALRGARHAAASLLRASERLDDLVLEVDFLRPVVPDGSLVTVEARLSTRTRRFVWLESRIVLPDGRVAARARVLTAISSAMVTSRS